MRWVRGLGLASVALAGCANATPATSDAGEDPADAAADPADASAAVDAPVTPDAPVAIDAPAAIDAGLPDAAASDAQALAWRHTITIDGTNDFDATDEAFSTTSPSYGAFITWDEDALYLGYTGPDIDAADANRWVLVYLDTDLAGVTAGATVGETYNTQQPGFPADFAADYYYRWRTSDDFHDLQAYDGQSWNPVAGNATDPVASGAFVELAIPLDDLGSPGAIGIVTLMLNETPLAEGAYAGLYGGSFTDGYYDADVEAIPLSVYLRADFASALAPNDLANQRP